MVLDSRPIGQPKEPPFVGTRATAFGLGPVTQKPRLLSRSPR